MEKKVIQFGDFREGLVVSEDPTNTPLGSARKIINGTITDRGGVSKRKGVKLLGTFDDSNGRCQGFKVFKKTDAITEIPIKALNTGKLQYYNPVTLDWALLKDDFTEASNFGFTHGFVRTGNADFIYGGNRNEDDFKWQGTVTKVAATAAIGATTLEVTSVLRPDIYEDKTASASSTTTLDVSDTPWVNDQWNGFYVYIKSGVEINKIRKITDTINNQITFDALDVDPGNCEFEIRYTDFPASGTLMIGNNEVVYSAMPEYNKFTVTALTAEATEDDPVTLVIVFNEGGPRGNRMCYLVGRRYIANVVSGMKRDSSGVLGGAAQPGSVFVSEVVNGLHNDGNLDSFSYGDPRVAGEGDIIAGVLGGAGHIDILPHNDAVYMFKPFSIESVAYSQDADDLANIEQPSPNYGAIMRPIKGKDDIYFVTSDKQLTTLGLVLQKADKEQATNIGLKVKRLLQDYSYEKTAKGGVYQNRIYIPVKSKSSDSSTNRLLVYNMDEIKRRFEGEWWLNIDSMDIFENELYFSSSVNSNVYKIDDGLNDILGSTSSNTQDYPITFEWLGNWVNLTQSKFNRQSVNVFACEGYILGNTKLTFNLYKNLQDIPFLSFDFEGTESGFVDVDFSSMFKGSLPKGLQPKGAVGTEVDNEGRRHFLFYLYFPFEYGEQFSWGFTNSGKDQSFEVIRGGMNPSEDTILDLNNRIKQLT